MGGTGGLEDFSEETDPRTFLWGWGVFLSCPFAKDHGKQTESLTCFSRSCLALQQSRALSRVLRQVLGGGGLAVWVLGLDEWEQLREKAELVPPSVFILPI